MKDNEVITQEALGREMPWLQRCVGNTPVKVQTFGPALWLRGPREVTHYAGEHTWFSAEAIYLLDGRGDKVALVGEVSPKRKGATMTIDQAVTVRQAIDQLSDVDKRRVRFILSRDGESDDNLYLLPPGGLEEAISSFEEKISTAQKDVLQTA